MNRAAWLLLGVLAIVAYGASQARAIDEFEKAFKEKYVDTSNDPQFKKAVEDANCNLCHVSRKKKTVRNDYGKALSKFMGGTVKKDLDAAQASGGDAGHQAAMDKILKTFGEALDKVADEKSPSGKTFGELIKDGQLPASK